MKSRAVLPGKRFLNVSQGPKNFGSRVQKIVRLVLGTLYLRVFFLFIFAYPQMAQQHEVAFESLFPTSPLTQVLALSMQAYGGLLAMRYTCAYEDFDTARASSAAVSEKLLRLDAALERLIANNQHMNLEDVEFLAGVIEKMARVCQLLLLCAPQDQGLLAVEITLGLLQKKLEALLGAQGQ